MDVKLANLYFGYRDLTSGPARHRLEVDQAAWLKRRSFCNKKIWTVVAKAYKDRVDYLYQHNTPAVCDGPLLKQPKGCDPGGNSEITDEDVNAVAAKPLSRLAKTRSMFLEQRIKGPLSYLRQDLF